MDLSSHHSLTVLDFYNFFNHLMLLQVAKSIKIVMTSRLASIIITLDMQTIQDAHLCITADVVKESILQAPRIKLKEQVKFCNGVF